MRRIDALAAAFARMNGALDPQSELFHLNNPGGLLAFNPAHERDEKGRRVFKHFIGGWENLTLDLKIKCSGKSRAKLTPESPLVDIIHTYGHPTTALKYVVNYLRHALKDNSIHHTVPLGWFLEDQKEQNGNATAA